MRARPGFTIVELLIVVVIIAILAAITIVAYNGITNRSYDSSVKADLASLAKKVEMYRIDDVSEMYPSNSTHLTALSLKASKNAYDTAAANLFYCTQASTRTNYVFAAKSRSGTVFYASSNGTGSLGNVAMTIGTVCGVIGQGGASTDRVNTQGYNGTAWNPWVG